MSPRPRIAWPGPIDPHSLGGAARSAGWQLALTIGHTLPLLPHIFLLLPRDVIILIEAFVSQYFGPGCNTMLMICRRSYHVLQFTRIALRDTFLLGMRWQHLRCAGPELQAVSIKMSSAGINTHRFDTQVADWIRGPPRPYAMKIALSNASDRLQAVQLAASLTFIRTLHLKLRSATSAQAAALSPLGTSPSLQIFKADLTGPSECSMLNATAATALAMISQAPHLHSLTLKLSRHQHKNPDGDAIAQALGAIRTAACLKYLHLDMSWMAVGDTGVQALCTLSQAPQLAHLELILQRCEMTDQLSNRFKSFDCPSLNFFLLDLRFGDVNAIAYDALRQALDKPGRIVDVPESLTRKEMDQLAQSRAFRMGMSVSESGPLDLPF